MPYGAPGLTGQQRRTREPSRAGPRAGNLSSCRLLTALLVVSKGLGRPKARSWTSLFFLVELLCSKTLLGVYRAPGAQFNTWSFVEGAVGSQGSRTRDEGFQDRPSMEAQRLPLTCRRVVLRYGTQAPQDPSYTRGPGTMCCWSGASASFTLRTPLTGVVLVLEGWGGGSGRGCSYPRPQSPRLLQRKVPDPTGGARAASISRPFVIGVPSCSLQYTSPQEGGSHLCVPLPPGRARALVLARAACPPAAGAPLAAVAHLGCTEAPPASLACPTR